MNGFVKSLLFRCFVAAAAIGVCAAPGCQPIQYEWQGPSSAFNGIDYNDDGAIDQLEREWVTGAYRDALFQYRVYDCDRDGRITWHEHFEYRFKNRGCPGAVTNFEKAVPAAVQRLSPVLTRPDESVDYWNGMVNVHREMGFLPPRFRNDYSEADPQPDQRAAVSLTAGVLESARVTTLRNANVQASEIEPVKSVSRLRCRVTNGSKDFRIRLVDLDIEWKNEDPESAPMKRGFLKTLLLEPGSASDLMAWFPAEVRAARCLLRGVRGQPAGRLR